MTAQQMQALLRAGQAGSSLASKYNSSLGAASPYFGNAASGLGIYGGLEQGGVGGYGSAAANTGKLAGSLTGNKALSTGAGNLGAGLGIYNGIKQGGVSGYGQAANGAAQLGANLGAFGGASGAVGSAAGYAAIPLALYNEIDNWESGNTGADAMGGAATGAAIGSVVPVVGTALGALIGGAAGALSSAFGPGRVDPENANFNAYTGAYNKADDKSSFASGVGNPYLPLAGYFDLRSGQLKGDNPLYTTYGRKGEKHFTDDLVSHINDAYKSGTLKPGASSDDVYSTAVAPWISGLGNWKDSNKDAMTALIKQMTNQYVSGEAAQDWKAIGGDSPFSKIYQGSPTMQTPAPQQAQPQAPQAPAIPQDIFKTPGLGGATTALARGGQVNDYERSARLHAIYSGGLRKSHYDDGGEVDYFSPSAGGYEFDPPPIQDLSGYFDQSNPFSGINQDLGDYGQNYVNASNNPYAYGYSDPSSGSSTAGTASSGIANLLKGLGISGNTASSLAPYAALAPILGSLLGVGKNQNKGPSLPSQYTGQVLNMPTPNFSRQQNNLSGMSMNDWLHAGEGPEIQYYRNNALPATAMSAPNQQAAQAISQATGQPFAGGYQYKPIQGSGQTTVGGVAPSAEPPPASPDMNIQPLTGLQGTPAVMAAGGAYDDPEGAYGTSAVGYVRGPGDGTSDSIKLKNAWLSNGEYVVDAPTVSILGAGSNDAGAKKLDAFRAYARKHAGKHLVKGKQPMKGVDPSAYFYGGGVQ